MDRMGLDGMGLGKHTALSQESVEVWLRIFGKARRGGNAKERLRLNTLPPRNRR